MAPILKNPDPFFHDEVVDAAETRVGAKPSQREEAYPLPKLHPIAIFSQKSFPNRS